MEPMTGIEPRLG